MRLNEAVSYYDAADRLRVFNRNVDLGPGSAAGGVVEEYRADALGRRVLVRSRCTAPQTGEACASYLERTVWDGAQTLLEMRTFASDTATAPTLENDHYTGPFLPAFCGYATRLGRVAYVHAGGVDAPLGAYRMNLPGFSGTIVALAPHANALGDPRTGSYIRGPCHGLETGTCGQPYPAVTWPGDNVTTDGLLTGGASYEAWYGTLLSQRTDGSRLHPPRRQRWASQATTAISEVGGTQ